MEGKNGGTDEFLAACGSYCELDVEETRKRYWIEQKLTLITNRKSVIAVQNLSSNLTCDATWRRNRRYVTSGFTNKITKIPHSSETVRDRAKVNIEHK